MTEYISPTTDINLANRKIKRLRRALVALMEAVNGLEAEELPEWEAAHKATLIAMDNAEQALTGTEP